MKLFLDSANLTEIREAMTWGAIDGVTTNPSLVAREQRDFFPLLKEICETVKGPVSMETTCRDAAGMVDEGRLFAALHPNILVKCPLTKEGLSATRQLTSEGIRVNVTLCFSAAQALLAAKAGAYFVSPFVGRLDDVSSDGMGLIREIRTIYDNYRYSTQILVASVRHPGHVVEAARIGADIATMPFAVLEALVRHPLTDIGLERFLKDWEKRPAAAKAQPPKPSSSQRLRDTTPSPPHQPPAATEASRTQSGHVGSRVAREGRGAAADQRQRSGTTRATRRLR